MEARCKILSVGILFLVCICSGIVLCSIGFADKKLIVNAEAPTPKPSESFLVDTAYRLFTSEQSAIRIKAMLMGNIAARTTSGHEQLREMLLENDTQKVRFAAITIMYAANLSDVPFLLRAANTHSTDESLVAGCIDTINVLLERPTHCIPGCRPPDLKKLSAWLSANKNVWYNKGYAKYWGEELPLALKAGRSEGYSHDTLEYFGQTLYMLVMSKDAGNAVPAIMKVISELNLKSDHLQFLPALASALQVYVGKLDVPAKDNRTVQIECRKNLLDWWEINKQRLPGHWALSRLTARGIKLDTKNPKGIIAWIQKALRGDSPAEQHTACLLLSYLFPASSDLPLPEASFLVAMSNPDSPLFDYIISHNICRSVLWNKLADSLVWDAKTGIFVFVQNGKKPNGVEAKR